MLAVDIRGSSDPGTESGLPSDSDAELHFHKLLSHRENVCPFRNCNLSFRRQDDLARHAYGHNGIKMFRCDQGDCGKTYITQSHLKRHVRSAHNPNRSNKRDHSMIISCTEPSCLVKFSTKQGMQKHYKTFHLNPKPYECGECKERFRRKLQLRQHQVTHTGVYPHKCTDCDRGFINLKALRRHSTDHHRTCDQCKETFTNWTELVRHKRLAHRPTFTCNVCGKTYPIKSLYNIHVQIHNPKDDRAAYECDYPDCPKFYYTMYALTAHKRLKHERKQFYCDVDGCGQSLSTKQKLLEHMRKMHFGVGRKVRKFKSGPDQRRTRKDCGVPKISAAMKLASIPYNSRIYKRKESVTGDGQPEIELIEDDLNSESISDGCNE